MKNRLIEKISGKQEIAKLNLLCFPYAGAGASVYYRWKEYFGNKVMIYAIQLPGRENRISEPMYASVDEIMPDLLEAVGEIVKEKFILFGHSMGAKIAYELEKRLEQSGIYARHLIVSGSRPPHIPEPNPICNLPKREFIRELTRFAGTPKEILGNEEMMNFFIPLLRADFEMDEKYLRKNKVKLECSINAFCGENDTEATETDMQECCS